MLRILERERDVLFVSKVLLGDTSKYKQHAHLSLKISFYNKGVIPNLKINHLDAQDKVLYSSRHLSYAHCSLDKRARLIRG